MKSRSYRAITVLKEIFYEKLYAECAGSLLMFNVGKGNTPEEDCWIALNYIKYIKTGCHYDQAVKIVRLHPEFGKLLTIAMLK